MSESAGKHEPVDVGLEGAARAGASLPGGLRGSRDPGDPVAAILGPRESSRVDWFYVGVAAALFLHAGMLGSAASSFYLHDCSQHSMSNQPTQLLACLALTLRKAPTSMKLRELLAFR